MQKTDEGFKTIHELTQHIDKVHPENIANLASSPSTFHTSTDSLLTWLKRTQEIVMNPLSNALNTSSDMIKFTTSAIPLIERNANRALVKRIYNVEFVSEDACAGYVEDLLSKRHFGTDQEFCTMCKKGLGLMNGRHHCRK